MFSIVSFDEVTSTNDYLKEHYRSYPVYSVILTLHQTHGRGRFDRVWESGDDLIFSMLFPHGLAHELIAPLAVVEALKQHEIEAEIKWPNDVLVEGKKVCGILIERVYEGNEAAVEIVGIGVNLSEKKDLSMKASYLALARNQIFTDILFQYEQLMKLSIEKLLDKIEKVSYLNGKTILLNGIIWEVDGIEEHGYLCIHHQKEKRILKSEEITLASIYEKEQL